MSTESVEPVVSSESRPIVLPLRPVRRGIFAVIAAVSLAGLAAELYLRGVSDPQWPELATALSLSYEGNVPTWLASCQLMLAAVVLAVLAVLSRHLGQPHGRSWALLSAVFCYISLDELVGIHERANELYHGHGILYFSWILVGAAGVAVVGLGMLPLLRWLHPRTRRRFVLAGCIFVTGGLVIEMPLGMVAERGGDETLSYALIDWCEETLELVGVGLFLATLLGLLGTGPGAAPGTEVRLVLGPAPAAVDVEPDASDSPR